MRSDDSIFAKDIAAYQGDVIHFDLTACIGLGRPSHKRDIGLYTRILQILNDPLFRALVSRCDSANHLLPPSTVISSLVIRITQ